MGIEVWIWIGIVAFIACVCRLSLLERRVREIDNLARYHNHDHLYAPHKHDHSHEYQKKTYESYITVSDLYSELDKFKLILKCENLEEKEKRRKDK